MSRTDSLKEYFNSLPEVKRIHELEGYIDSNDAIKKAFESLKDIQKQMVNAKEFHQENQYQIYKEQYEAARSTLLDLPFVEEYLELLEITDGKLKEFTSLTEEALDKKING